MSRNAPFTSPGWSDSIWIYCLNVILFDFKAVSTKISDLPKLGLSLFHIGVLGQIHIWSVVMWPEWERSDQKCLCPYKHGLSAVIIIRHTDSGKSVCRPPDLNFMQTFATNTVRRLSNTIFVDQTTCVKTDQRMSAGWRTDVLTLEIDRGHWDYGPSTQPHLIWAQQKNEQWRWFEVMQLHKQLASLQRKAFLCIKMWRFVVKCFAVTTQ